jgi:hypothetical protein
MTQKKDHQDGCLEQFSTILTEQETKEKPTLLKTQELELAV